MNQTLCLLQEVTHHIFFTSLHEITLKCTYLAVRIIVPCCYYSYLLFYVLNYVTRLTLYFILVQYTVKNSRDEISIIFNKELVAMSSGM